MNQKRVKLRSTMMRVAALVLVTVGVRADSIPIQRFTRYLAGITSGCAGLSASVAPDELDQVRDSAARLSDMAVTAEVCDVNRAEFKQVEKQAQALRFKRIHFYYQAPDKFRVDSHASRLLRVSVIQNGDRQTWRTSMGLRRTVDLSNEQARKQDTLEIGILTPPLWESYQIQRLDDESIEGSPCLALKMTLAQDPSYGHQVVWLDRKTFRVVGWERITTAGERKLRYMFRQPEQSPDGIWYSRRIELYTPEDHFVGALQFTDVSINQGLNSALFR